MAADSMMKATVHEPVGHGGRNWITRMKAQLPAYIQHIANDLREKRGKDESAAIRMAIGIVKRWARGGGSVKATTRAAAAKAVAEWEKLKAKAKGFKAGRKAGGAIAETPAELNELLALDVEELLTPEELAIVEAYVDDEPPEFALGFEVGDDVIGDVTLLEAVTKPTPMSNTKRRPGESLHSWGVRLKAGDKRLAAQSKTKTRSGASSSSFESKHPRGRGGEWTLKQGASGAQVRAVQSQVGAKTDGKYGSKTAAAVRRYQQKHGLKVDGVVGAQTAAQMNGKDGKKVKPGKAPKGTTIRRARRGKLMESIDNFELTEEQVGDLSLLEAPAESPSDMKVRCPKCKTKNPMSAKTCSKCGHNLADAKKAMMARKS